jgi:hypothetical protein
MGQVSNNSKTLQSLKGKYILLIWKEKLIKSEKLCFTHSKKKGG